MVSRSAAVEEYFQPRVVSPADFLRGVDVASAPFLHGYVATKMKALPAQEILESELGEPILARWHVGLGWTLAWTSDVKNLWAVEWLRWPQWGQFWGQLVREHMRQKKRQVFDMRAETDPATGHVRAVLDAIGMRRPIPERARGLADRRRTAAGGRGSQGADAADRAGALRGRLPARSLRLVSSPRLAREQDRGRPRRHQGATATVAESFGHVTNPYPREYLALSPDVATLSKAADATGGAVNAPATALFDPAGESIRYHEDLWPRFVGAAIALFLLDLLVRRVRIFDRKRVARSGAVRRAPAA